MKNRDLAIVASRSEKPGTVVAFSIPPAVRVLSTPPASRMLRFGSYELDVRAGELRKGGIKLRLQGQPIQVLATLLGRPGELVTREELRAQIWPAETFVDFDHGLHNAISRIREVLGDSTDNPRFIETLPRRGYRFKGSVETAGLKEPPAQAPAPVEVQPAEESPVAAVPQKRRAFVMPVVVLIGVVAGALALVLTVSRRAASVPVVRSIAVLPLANFSGRPCPGIFRGRHDR